MDFYKILVMVHQDMIKLYKILVMICIGHQYMIKPYNILVMNRVGHQDMLEFYKILVMNYLWHWDKFLVQMHVINLICSKHILYVDLCKVITMYLHLDFIV